MRAVYLLLFLISNHIAFKANASNIKWYDLSSGMQLNLTQEINFTQVTILPASQLTLEEIIPLSMIKVSLYKLYWHDCAEPSLEQEMILLAVDNTNVEIGLELLQNCNLELYIEDRDLFQASIFN
jgi:hypothetical protein